MLNFGGVISNSTDFPDFDNAFYLVPSTSPGTFLPFTQKKGFNTHTHKRNFQFFILGSQNFFPAQFFMVRFPKSPRKPKSHTAISGAKITTVNVDEFQRRIGSMRDDARDIHIGRWPFFFYMAEHFSGGEKLGV